MKADFSVTSHGSVLSIKALSDVAIELANSSFPVEPWMGKPTDFTTDWRAGRELCQQLADEGFEIEVL